MDEVLKWPLRGSAAKRKAAEMRAGATARFGGEDGDRPVLVATIGGPVAIEMARDALAEAGIPALVKQSSLGPIYGLTIGAFGSAEVWVVPALAEQAYDTLVGIGLIEPPDQSDAPEAP